MSKQISCRFVRLFQSTPSSRRATFWKVTATTTPAHFNPRPPHGGRLGKVILSSRLYKFQSTPSSRRATFNMDKAEFMGRHFNPRPPHGGRLNLHFLSSLIDYISIHALLTEGDSRRCCIIYHCLISIHALLTEGDSKNDKFIFF